MMKVMRKTFQFLDPKWRKRRRNYSIMNILKTYQFHKVASVWAGLNHLRILRFLVFRLISNIVIRTQKCKGIRIRPAPNISLDPRETTINSKVQVRWCVIDRVLLRMVMILKTIKMVIMVARGNVDPQNLVAATVMEADREVGMTMTLKVMCRPLRTWASLQVSK